MTVPLTSKMRNTIYAVQAYYAMVKINNTTSNNIDDVCYDYFLKLPLTEGFERNTRCYKAVILYPIKETEKTPDELLPEKFSFDY